MSVIVCYRDSEFSMLLTISAFVFLLSVYLMQKSIAVFNISRLTIPAFWYLTYLVKKSWINEYFTKPIEKGMTGSHTTFVYAVFLILSVSLALLYLTSIETIPLFFMLQHPNQPEQLAILREE